MELYATESKTLTKITITLVYTGINGAALLSLSQTFYYFLITNLNAGQTVTFPMFVWGAAQRGVPMQVNVIGTLMFLIAIAVVLSGEVAARRRSKALAA
jgi:spermidine/putrescine transport system permease protein